MTLFQLQGAAFALRRLQVTSNGHDERCRAILRSDEHISHRSSMDCDGVSSRRQNRIAPVRLVLDCEFSVWLLRRCHQRRGDDQQEEICDLSRESHCPISNRKLGDGRKSELSVPVWTTRAYSSAFWLATAQLLGEEEKQLLARSDTVERPH